MSEVTEGLGPLETDSVRNDGRRLGPVKTDTISEVTGEGLSPVKTDTTSEMTGGLGLLKTDAMSHVTGGGAGLEASGRRLESILKASWKRLGPQESMELHEALGSNHCNISHVECKTSVYVLN